MFTSRVLDGALRALYQSLSDPGTDPSADTGAVAPVGGFGETPAMHGDGPRRGAAHVAADLDRVVVEQRGDDPGDPAGERRRRAPRRASTSTNITTRPVLIRWAGIPSSLVNRSPDRQSLR
ncbi:hypothetical protein ACQEVB_24035 [Pseudonocardia sp. CA-107938]|uniref:hypothetical protein n=1 Tax=Pseudonocardia sp. CA-107938 TaxID=3240021 RepID=UPI003D8B3C6B